MKKTIIHVGDPHLDASRPDSLEAWDFVVSAVEAQAPDLVLIPGDLQERALYMTERSAALPMLNGIERMADVCPVVGVYPKRGRALLYGGAVHLSLDSMEDAAGRTIFGQVSARWPGAATLDSPLVSLSQEHGVVATSAALSEELAPGGLVCVLPVHACLTCNLHSE